MLTGYYIIPAGYTLRKKKTDCPPIPPPRNAYKYSTGIHSPSFYPRTRLAFSLDWGDCSDHTPLRRRSLASRAARTHHRDTAALRPTAYHRESTPPRSAATNLTVGRLRSHTASQDGYLNIQVDHGVGSHQAVEIEAKRLAVGPTQGERRGSRLRGWKRQQGFGGRGEST